jgi:hypothetical protein
VSADPQEEAKTVRTHNQKYGYSLGVLLDPHRVLVKLTGVKVTPEAAFLSDEGPDGDRCIAAGLTTGIWVSASRGPLR